MAQRVEVTLIDDVDGSTPADQTVRFSLDGVNYEIDLSNENADALRNAFEPFVSKARRLSGRRTRSASNRPSVSYSLVREWAGENNITVSPRGRIPQKVIDAYNAAHA